MSAGPLHQQAVQRTHSSFRCPALITDPTPPLLLPSSSTFISARVSPLEVVPSTKLLLTLPCHVLARSSDWLLFMPARLVSTAAPFLLLFTIETFFPPQSFGELLSWLPFSSEKKRCELLRCDEACCACNLSLILISGIGN